MKMPAANISVKHPEGHIRSAGRGGLGAVMGSKKLKAIAVRGSSKPSPADADAFKEVKKTVSDKIKEGMFTMALGMMGTNAGMVMGMTMGDVPTKNWSLGGDDDLANDLS